MWHSRHWVVGRVSELDAGADGSVAKDVGRRMEMLKQRAFWKDARLKMDVSQPQPEPAPVVKWAASRVALSRGDPNWGVPT